MPSSAPSTLRRASDSIVRRLQRGPRSPTDVEPSISLHRAWGIDDIVRLILQHCDLHAAVALARTCSYLFCLAVEVVWTRCRDLDYLQRHMLGGKDAVALVYRKLQSTPLQARSFRLDAQTRTALYCARIRALSVDQHAIDTDPLNSLSRFLGNRSLQSSFPKLRRVALTIFTNKALETAVQFVTELSQLEYVGVYHRAHFVDWPVGDTTGHLMQRRLPTTFKALRLLPRLDFLRVEVDDGRLDHGGEAYEFVEALTTTNLNPSSLRLRFRGIISPYLSLLPKFTRLLSLECLLVDNLVIPTALALPRLEHLMVSTRSIDALNTFLARLRCPNLFALDLKPEHTSEMYDAPYAARVFEDTASVIAKNWPGLERFGLCYRAPLAAPGLIMWSFRPFRGLLACAGLKAFVLNAEPWVVLQDEDVQDIVAAWPNLEVFVIGSLKASQQYRPMWQELSYDAITLLAACPSLRTLVLLHMFVGNPEADFSPVAPGSSLADTVILHEPQRNEEKEAGRQVLGALFPHLTTIRQTACPRCGSSRRQDQQGAHLVLTRRPHCCIRDVADRLGVPGLKECLFATCMQKKIEGDCILCQMDFVSDFETFAEWCNMYGS